MARPLAKIYQDLLAITTEMIIAMEEESLENLQLLANSDIGTGVESNFRRCAEVLESRKPK